MPKLIEVLDYFDNTGSVMVHRMPPKDEDAEIKWGAQLTVRETQTAIFFKDGIICDVFAPGRYVLSTKNIPVLSKLLTSIVYGETSPFRAEVYFINLKLMPNLKWGTPEPILFRDEDFQMVRLRSNGIFSIQIADPKLFLTTVVGTQGIFTDSEIAGYLRNLISSELAVVLGEKHKSVFDLPKNYSSISSQLRERLTNSFSSIGLHLHNVLINSITVPDEVQKSIDAKTGISAIGNIDEYLKFQMGKSLDNPNSTGSLGAGLGTGIGMGMIVPQLLKNILDSESNNTTNEELFELIEKLKSLLDKGAITKSEFDESKQKLLQKIK
jgi:membrane protease subunit (stomatin/prohibitin family)